MIRQLKWGDGTKVLKLDGRLEHEKQWKAQREEYKQSPPSADKCFVRSV